MIEKIRRRYSSQTRSARLLGIGVLCCFVPSQAAVEGMETNSWTSVSTVSAVQDAMRGVRVNDIATLEWSMTLIGGGHTLRINYQIRSLSDTPVYISDLLPIPGPKKWQLGVKSIMVTNASQPETVRFVRGRLQSEAPLARVIDPGARKLEPHQSLSGMAEVSLPLQGYHYQGTVAPLKTPLLWAVLEIGVIVGQVHWSELPLDDGSKLTISHPSDPMQVLRSNRQRIPVK